MSSAFSCWPTVTKAAAKLGLTADQARELMVELEKEGVFVQSIVPTDSVLRSGVEVIRKGGLSRTQADDFKLAREMYRAMLTEHEYGGYRNVQVAEG